MNVPKITHLQFLILGVLREGSTPGRAVRERLRSFRVRKSGPAFYQLMARLEDGGLVEGWYEQQIVDSQIIRERHYKLTGNGGTAWEASRDFYLKTIRDFGGLKGLANA